MTYHEKVLFHLKQIKQEIVSKCSCEKGCGKCAPLFEPYKLMADAGIPLKYWKMSLNMLGTKALGVKETRNYLNKLSIAYEKGQGIILYGKNGVGKTLAACSIGKEALRLGYTVRFTFLNEVISAFVDTMYDPVAKEELRRDILGVDFLILDDVDKAYLSNSGYINSILDTLFRTRSQSNLPTIMTANKPIEDIINGSEEVFVKSLLSLFDESLIPILFMGTDIRKVLKEQARKEFLEDDDES